MRTFGWCGILQMCDTEVLIADTFARTKKQCKAEIWRNWYGELVGHTPRISSNSWRIAYVKIQEMKWPGFPLRDGSPEPHRAPDANPV
jgi:hypothetical protein